MKEHQIDTMHRELKEAARAVLAKYGMDLQPSSLTYSLKTDRNGVEDFRVQIKGVTQVTLETAVTADHHMIKAGLARPGTKAWVTDRGGQRREVIITESKRVKYGFYFADDPRKRSMLGRFSLFSANQ